MRNGLIGLAILLLGIGLCWGVLYLGQANGADWVVAVIGQERASGDAPMVDTLFNLFIFVPLIVIAIGTAAVERRNAAALGDRPLAGLTLGLAVGLAGLTVSILYARLAGALTDGSPQPAMPAVLIWGLGVTAVQVLAEEIYFRGWLQPALVARWGQAAGIVAAALAFGALHVAGGARAPMSLLNLFLGGLMFGLFAARSRGLAAAIGAHFAWNATEQLGFGLDPNPGIGSFGSLVDRELVGNALWGGSDQGLNGSVGMTVALLAIVAPLLIVSWRRLPVPSLPEKLTSSARPG